MVKQEEPKAVPTVESKPETTVPETVDEADKIVEQPKAPGKPEKAKVEGKQAEVAIQGTEEAPEKVVPEAEVPPEKIEQEPPKLPPPEPPAEKTPVAAEAPPKCVKYIRQKTCSFAPVLKLKRDGPQKTDSLKEVLQDNHNALIESVADSLWHHGVLRDHSGKYREMVTRYPRVDGRVVFDSEIELYHLPVSKMIAKLNQLRYVKKFGNVF